MLIYHRHIFVLYIIYQNNPVSKSVRLIIPRFLRNRSYRRRAQATVVTQLSYRRPLFGTNLPTVVSRRIFRGSLYQNENRYESVVLVQGVPYLRASLL